MYRNAIVVAALATSATASADPKFEYGKREELEKVKETEWNAAVEAGVVFTTGNSETTTVTAGTKIARKRGNNKLAFEGSLAYARSSVRIGNDVNEDGEIGGYDEIETISSTTAQTLNGKLRYDRFLTEHNSIFAAFLASRDLPAGKEKVLGGQLGYSRRLYKSEKAEAVGEFGYDYANEDLVAGDPVSIHSARAFVGFKAEMSEGVNFDTSAEALTNINKLDLVTDPDGASIGEDTRVNVKAAIAAKIGKNLAFQTSLEARFDNRPAPLKIDNLAADFVPEAAKLDTIMKASLLYTFF